jgi:DnaJ like chaperone protein
MKVGVVVSGVRSPRVRSISGTNAAILCHGQPTRIYPRTALAKLPFWLFEYLKTSEKSIEWSTNLGNRGVLKWTLPPASGTTHIGKLKLAKLQRHTHNCHCINCSLRSAPDKLTTSTFHSELLAVLSKHRSADFQIGKHICPDKLKNAVAHFPISRGEKVVGLIDCTVFGSCKVGLAITLNGLIWKNDWTTDSTQTKLTWQELVDSGSTIHAASMGITFSPGINFNMSGSAMKPASLIQLCLALIDIGERGSACSDMFSNIASSDEGLDTDAVVVALIAKFAKTDNVITRNQIAFMENFFDDMSDGETTEKARYIAIFNRAKNEDVSVYQLARRLTAIESDDEFFSGIYEVLWQIALVDGTPTNAKKDILREIPAHLGLPRAIYEQAIQYYIGNNGARNRERSQPDPQLSKYFQMLNCAPDVSDAELKMAYRRKMSSLHPDKLQSKELAEELMQFATQQVQKINYAYDQILKHRSA